MRRKKILLEILIISSIYLFLNIIPFGGLILYPLDLFVTFLHELGHASACFLTGGEVVSLQINPDGSGLTKSAGGWRWLIISGGYIGSAIFGNLMIYLSTKEGKYSSLTLDAIVILMCIANFFWFSNPLNFIILAAMGGAILLLARTSFHRIVLLSVGVVSVIKIILDFNVGPSSDISQFNNLLPIGYYTWMIIWLAVVLSISYWTFRKITSLK